MRTSAVQKNEIAFTRISATKGFFNHHDPDKIILNQLRNNPDLKGVHIKIDSVCESTFLTGKALRGFLGNFFGKKIDTSMGHGQPVNYETLSAKIKSLYEKA